MYARKRHSKRLACSRTAAIAIATGCILSGILLPYAGFFVYAMEDYNQVAYKQPAPDPSSFIPANDTLLHAMAMWFEDNIARYHMPHDMIVYAYFNDSTSVGAPLWHHGSTDSAEWTGHYLMAEAFRYAVHKREGNSTLAEAALGNITRALMGYDKILHVAPNGGLARYAWPINEYPGGITDNRHLGTWNGEYYIFEDDTSRDMHNGVIMGLGLTYLLVDDEATRAMVTRLVTDMLDVLISRGWLYVKPDGVPNGTDLDAGYWFFGTCGLWTLAYLKTGMLVNATRFGPLYKEYAIDRDYIHRSNFPDFSRTNLVQSYYGLLLDWEVMFLLATLEEEPGLRAHYLAHVDAMYSLTKHDRTAIFNAMWLALHGHDGAGAGDAATVIGDVEDCLMRYHGAPQRLPGRNYPVSNPGMENARSAYWVDFFSNGPGKSLYPFWESIYQFKVVADKPLTPDRRGATDFLWSRSPYTLNATGNGRSEGTGADYTVVYWLCRYFNITGAPQDYTATVEAVYGA